MKKKWLHFLKLLRDYGVVALSLALIERILNALSKKLDALSLRASALKERAQKKRAEKRSR